MKRLLLATSVVAFSLLIAGCNSDSVKDAEKTSKEETQKPTMLEQGAFYVPTSEDQAAAELEEYFREMELLYGDQISGNTSSGEGGASAVQGQSKFTKYTDLSAKFMEYCETGNVDGMFSLYYDNALEKTYERVKDDLTKEEFRSRLQQEMLTVYDYEEMEYGSSDMPAMSSPLSYVNQFLYRSGLETLTLTDAQVTDCTNLRVYKQNGYAYDYILACIEGYWYVVS